MFLLVCSLHLAIMHHEKSRNLLLLLEVVWISRKKIRRKQTRMKPHVGGLLSIFVHYSCFKYQTLIIRKINKEFLKWAHCVVLNWQMYLYLICFMCLFLFAFSYTACSQKLPLDHEQHISICTPEVLITGEKPKNV